MEYKVYLLHVEDEDDCPDPDDGRGEGDEK